LPQAGALVCCYVSEGQEAGRAGCLTMLVFGQPGLQGNNRPQSGHRLRSSAARRARLAFCRRLVLLDAAMLAGGVGYAAPSSAG